MLRAFSTAATGMSAQQTVVDVIAHNLANINTAGFKRSQVDFQDLVYVKVREAGAQAAGGAYAPSGIEIGSGVRVAATPKVFTQGEQENTGSPLDVAIQGPGFFEVTSPGGEVRYTRDGGFQRSPSGQLVTAAGNVVAPGITIPAGAEVSIAEDGTVTVHTVNGTNVAGQITLVRFPNPAGLRSDGGNLLSATDASGAAMQGTPGSDGLGTVMQGFLERSNVQMVTELVNLIKAQRAYEINSRAIRAGDEMLNTANRLIQ